jgi:hypothetical protein
MNDQDESLYLVWWQKNVDVGMLRYAFHWFQCQCVVLFGSFLSFLILQMVLDFIRDHCKGVAALLVLEPCVLVNRTYVLYNLVKVDLRITAGHDFLCVRW